MAHALDDESIPAGRLPTDTRRYRCVDYTSYYAGNDFLLVTSWTTGSRQVLPAIAEQLLKACDKFRTLEEHARLICQGEPFREVPPASIQELLFGLVSAGLLVAHDDLAARVGSIVGQNHPASIETVAVLTYNRPDGLRRVISTTAENAARHGRRVQFVVADDSDDQHQQANLAVLADLRDRYGVEVWYAGPHEKATYARKLAEHCAVPLEVVNVALTHPAGWPAVPGVNRNTLLLHTVGEPFLSLDDDMVCTIARLPKGDDGLALSSDDVTQSWFYPDSETTLRRSEIVDEDVLGLHESMLGANVGRLISEWQASGARGPLDLDTLEGHFLKNLEQDGGRVVLTMAGILGDSGMGDSVPLYFVEGPTLERLFSADGGYQGAMASRQAARGVLRRTVTDDDHCMAGNLGVDNRGLLPPFQTVARNEDGIFGALVRRTIPGSCIGVLPRTILHDPVVTRRFTLVSFDEVVCDLGVSDVMLHLLSAQPEVLGHATTRQRLVAAGQYLTAIGALPPTDFAERLRDIWLGVCSSNATLVEKILRRQMPPQPETWTADLQRYQAALLDRLERDAPITIMERRDATPEQKQAALQRYLGDFGRLLCAWPDLVEGARELCDRGHRPARRLAEG